MKKLIEKANILIESLPFIRSFYGKTFVIKYGGAAQTDEVLKDSFARDVALLNFIGIRPVIVHGGGPRISETMKTSTHFTDSEIMAVPPPCSVSSPANRAPP